MEPSVRRCNCLIRETSWMAVPTTAQPPIPGRSTVTRAPLAPRDRCTVGRLRRGDMLPNQGNLPGVPDLDGSIGTPEPPHTPAAPQVAEARRIISLWGLAVDGRQ